MRVLLLSREVVCDQLKVNEDMVNSAIGFVSEHPEFTTMHKTAGTDSGKNPPNVCIH